VRLDDDDFVRGQYGTTAKLEARMSVWHPDDEGRWPQDVALTALAQLKPERLLEVGAGRAHSRSDGRRSSGAR
jgi:hypothetical protein